MLLSDKSMICFHRDIHERKPTNPGQDESSAEERQLQLSHSQMTIRSLQFLASAFRMQSGQMAIFLSEYVGKMRLVFVGIRSFANVNEEQQFYHQDDKPDGRTIFTPPSRRRLSRTFHFGSSRDGLGALRSSSCDIL
jgi:hypothetical protein